MITMENAPPLHQNVICCVNDGENVYFMIGKRVHIDVPDSFIYYSPEHGEEYPLEDVEHWHKLP